MRKVDESYYDLGQALASYFDKILIAPNPAEYRERWKKAAHVLECLERLVRWDSGTIHIELENHIELKMFFLEQFGMATFLAAGDIDPRIAGVVGPGSPPADPLKLKLIGFANLYIAMAKDDQINDPYPIKTIQDEYGVDRTTAQGWGRSSMAHPTLVARNLSPSLVTRLMTAAGKDYRRLPSRRHAKL